MKNKRRNLIFNHQQGEHKKYVLIKSIKKRAKQEQTNKQNKNENKNKTKNEKTKNEKKNEQEVTWGHAKRV